MTAVVICPTPILQFFLNSGAPAAGGSVLTQVGGVNAATYSDSAGTILLPNPIPLNSRGEVSTSAGASAQLFLPANTVYTFTLSDASGNQIWVAPFVDGFQITQAQVGAALYPQTAAELAVPVTPVNFQYPPGHAYRYGTNTAPGTTDMTAALANSLLQAYQVGGSDPFWPAGTLVASQLTISQPVRIRTDGYATVIQQLFTSGLSNTPIILVQASNVIIDPLTLIGNIATDTLEFNHAIQVGGTSTNSHVTLLGVRASNIRGDIVYLGGTTAFPLYDVSIGEIDGTNIYRNCLSAVGVNGLTCDSVTGSQVGYRHFDCETNAGSQNPTNIRIKFLLGWNIQLAAGANPPPGSVTFDGLYLDNNLNVNSTPGYPTHPSQAGNIGIIIGNCQNFHVGSLFARNFQERLFNSAGANTIPCSAVFEYVDIASCNTTEVTFQTLFNVDSFVTLEIKSGTIVLAGIARYIAKGGGLYRLRDLNISGGCVAATSSHCEFENLAINANTVTGNLFASINSSLFKNVVVTNDGSATMMILCSDNTFIGYSGNPSAFNTTGGSHVLVKSTLAGNAYHANAIETAVAFNPGAILSGATAQTVVTGVNGAVLGDFALASFIDVPTGYGTVTWTANVTNANAVTVTYRNTGGSTVTFGNNTLRVTVFKKMT